MLTWMALNCVVDPRVNGTILRKKEHKDPPKKIDGIDALIMAIGGATRAKVGAESMTPTTGRKGCSTYEPPTSRRQNRTFAETEVKQKGRVGRVIPRRKHRLLSAILLQHCGLSKRFPGLN